MPSEQVETNALHDKLVESYGSYGSSAYLRERLTLAGLLLQRIFNPGPEVGYIENPSNLPVKSDLKFRQQGGVPSPWRHDTKRVVVRYNCWLLLLVGTLGDPFTWSSLQEGSLIVDVMQIYGREYFQIDHTSPPNLNFHVAYAFHDSRCYALGLSCLRSPTHVVTAATSSKSHKLPSVKHAVLEGQRPRIHPDPEHFNGLAATPQPCRTAVIFEELNDAHLRMNQPYTAVDEGGPIHRSCIRDNRHPAST